MEKMEKKIQAAKSAWKCAQNYCSNFGTFPEKKGEKHTLCGGVNFSSSTKAWNTEEGKKGAL